MNQRHTSFALLPTLLAMFLAACDGPKAAASTMVTLELEVELVEKKA